ncbi:competence/damage-inducible protein A [Fusobacterium sp.]|uniref:competence/damage-inducible protein A n=1 Tax=Fusobacterium sp. TaxID=68766 RepID=UPI002615228F|nr:competence/damage-inducible protein A [Fusobacterium sp.]
MKATLILVGTELLSGGMIDTNSLYMAEELNKYGIEIGSKITVKDKIEDIINAITYGKENSDLIIMSGGLGPTIDDITKEAIAKYLNKKLVVDQDELNELKEKFRERNLKFIEINTKEVEKPEGSVTFKNGAGMAPAVYIDGIVCFPGVPIELYDMFPKFLKWYSEEKKLKSDEILIKDLITYGIAESLLDNKISDIFTEEGIDYEFLVKDFGIIIRLQSKISNKNIVEKIVEKIYNRVGDNIFGEDSDRLEKLIIKSLKEKGKTLSVAESCTGGLLSDSFVNVSGASEVFMEGIVTYSNDAKIKRLGVKKETLEKFGAVSEETAREMVLGLKTDVGISVTGIAGPLGGTKEKPVGLVYMGIRNGNEVEVEKKVFKGSRRKVRERAVLHSLFCLNKMLKRK